MGPMGLGPVGAMMPMRSNSIVPVGPTGPGAHGLHGPYGNHESAQGPIGPMGSVVPWPHHKVVPL